jgi:type VI secretion system secreted protein VgrG
MGQGDTDDGAQAAGAQALSNLVGDRLEVVSFRFRALNGPDPDWHVRRVKLNEAISQPYELVVDIMTEELGTATDDLLGADVEFEIERGHLPHAVYGVIHRVDYIGITTDKLLVRVWVAPAFRLLAQQINTRIFQDVTVLEIVEQVLTPGLQIYGRTYDAANNKIAQADQYPKHDYCVQYGESDFDFVSRLLEEEGIAYYFEPDVDANKEKLILINNNNDYPEVALIGDPSVPIIPDNPETADRESLRYFEWSRPEQINKVVAWHYNWKVGGEHLFPVQHLEAEIKGSQAERGRIRELYLHGDRRKIVDKADDEGFDGSAIDELAPLVERRWQLFDRQAQRGQGRSNVTGFAAGYKFELLDHSRAELGGVKFLITRVVHSGDSPEEERHAAGGQQRYENSFECIPEEKPFRPALVTRRPRIYGPTTAIVTGPSGEEIHTDKHGRIKIKFPWDRVSPTDETSSCWARVAQSWAGPGWGAMFIPRIGMEVVVEFLEGNPDRPLVTGCVYNAQQPPPFALPDNKTKTTVKSQSSPNKAGYNEITFEDLAGSEQIIVHAQKDYNEKVENLHNLGVGSHQTYDIGGDQKITVKGSQFITVKGQPQKGDFKGSATEVTGKYTVNASDLIAMKAPNSVKVECPGSYILLEPGKITMVAGGNATVVLDANVFAKANGGATLLLDANVGAKSNAGSVVTLDANALMKSSGGSKVLLDGNALVKANSGAQVVLDANALVDGGESTLHGKSLAQVSSPTSKIGDGTISIKGSTVSIDGGGATGKFAGGTVKLN